MTAHGGGAARWNSETQQWDDGAPPPAPYTGPPPPRPAWSPAAAPAAPSADEPKKRLMDKTSTHTAAAAGPAHRVLVGKIVDGVD
ncbi:hypothetical protein ACFWWQ_29515, partial [Streptomyces sp. NPDC059080]